ncbi:hypothetical protein pb186bvf_005748 [Paramecium bursaria]
MAERVSVKQLTAQFNQISNDVQKNVYQPKTKRCESNPPQIQQAQANSEQLTDNVEELQAIIQKQKYDLNRLNFEMTDLKSQFNKLVQSTKDLQIYQTKYPQLFQQNKELEKQNVDLKCRLELAYEKLDGVDTQKTKQQNKYLQDKGIQADLLNDWEKQSKKNVFQQSFVQKSLQDQEVQVELINYNTFNEQKQLLLMRLNEQINLTNGGEYIVINTIQSENLKLFMEQLLKELVSRLNHYQDLIINKKRSLVKQDIRKDIMYFQNQYIKMFEQVNRPISNVDQVGKILSPKYQDELNNFLQTLSDFLNKFTQFI